MSSSKSRTNRDNSRAARVQADARGIPAQLMFPRIVMLLAVLALVLIGFIMVFSASRFDTLSSGAPATAFMFKQAIFSFVGIVFCFVLARVLPYHIWADMPGYIAYIFVLVLLVSVSLVGHEGYGATRWVSIAGFTLQPSEFAKIGFIVVFASLYSRYIDEELDFSSTIKRIFFIVLIPVGFLFVTQSDLGTTLVVLVGIAAILWLGRMKIRYFGIAILLMAVFGAIALILKPYRWARIKIWLDPWSDPLGDGFQVVRSFYAFAEGGLFGVGLGNSHEKFYLPMAHNDFIYAVLGEEMGFIGAVLVIILFLIILVCGLKIANNAPTSFGKFLAGGLTAMIVGQAFLNMGCTIGVLPVTGKPLPFISAGGSSLISSFIVLGLILAVSVGSNTLTVYERRRNDLNVLTMDNDTSEEVSYGGMTSGLDVFRDEYEPRRASRYPASSKREFSVVDTRRTSRPYSSRTSTRLSSSNSDFSGRSSRLNSSSSARFSGDVSQLDHSVRKSSSRSNGARSNSSRVRSSRNNSSRRD